LYILHKWQMCRPIRAQATLIIFDMDASLTNARSGGLIYVNNLTLEAELCMHRPIIANP